MYIFFKSTYLQQKGFTSLFRTHIITLSMEQAFSFEFKARSSYLGCFYELPTENKATVITICSGSISETYPLQILEGIGELKINTEKFKGILQYEIVNGCQFTFLENKRLESTRITKHSKLILKPERGISRRIGYDSTIYHADLYEDLVQSSNTKVNELCVLPRGWERRFLKNGRAYFINHNKNYTQWEVPNDPAYVMDINQASNKYRVRSAQMNIFGLFDFSKFTIVVMRSHMIQSTADLLLTANHDKINRDPIVVFSGEIGEDWGALLKEFFSKASSELLADERIKCIGCVYDVKTMEERKSENNKLLSTHMSKGGTPPGRIFESKIIESITSKEHLSAEDLNNYFTDLVSKSAFLSSGNKGLNILSDQDFFTYMGIFIGMAYKNKVNINMDMSLVFYENLMKREFSLYQIQDVQVQNSINFIKTCDLTENEIYDEYNDILLTDENRMEYVIRLVCDFTYISKKKEYDWIRGGFYRVISAFIVEYLGTFDLMLLLGGNEEITVGMIVETVKYIKCNNETKEVQFLWKILEEEDEYFLRKFLQYVTGSPSIPIGSIKSMRFCWHIEKTSTENMLFKASTCVNRLYIGSYKDILSMKRILLFSLENTEGFHKV